MVDTKTDTTALVEHMLDNGANTLHIKIVLNIAAGLTAGVPLSRKLDVSERAVRRGIRWLKDHGYLCNEQGARELRLPDGA